MALILNGGTGSSTVTAQSNGITVSGDVTASTVTTNSTSHIKVPAGTTAQRPSGQLGYFRINSDGAGVCEYYSNTAWTKLSPLLDGSTSSQAAPSAQYIKDNTATTTSGYYWISLGGVARQVWCDMSGSTAWMLAMRCANGGTTFGWSSAYWTNTAGLNNTANPLTDTDIKNEYVWQSWSVTQIRLTGSTSVSGYTDNPLIFGTFSAPLYTIFNSGNNIYDGQIALGRSGWINWSNAACSTASSYWDNQPNCNSDQINAYFTYHAARIGISFNNEADCATNDSGVGFGLYRNGISELSCGSIRWSPDTRFGCHGWLWVR